MLSILSRAYGLCRSSISIGMELRRRGVTCEISTKDEFFWWEDLFRSSSFCDRELGGIDIR